MSSHSEWGNYCILSEYHKYVLPPLTWIVGPTMNLISGIHHSCEKNEYAFMVIREYTIISQKYNSNDIPMQVLISLFLTLKHQNLHLSCWFAPQRLWTCLADIHDLSLSMLVWALHDAFLATCTTLLLNSLTRHEDAPTH